MYWLNIFFLINGMWITGEAFEGWHARGPFPTLSECILEKIRSETEFSENPREFPARFQCSRERPRIKRDLELCLQEGLPPREDDLATCLDRDAARANTFIPAYVARVRS